MDDLFTQITSFRTARTFAIKRHYLLPVNDDWFAPN
jgi:hypothetical protein